MAERAWLDEHRAYIGASGSGKSTTARGDVEQLLRDRRHICITDHTGVWWGLRSDAAGTGPGFDIPIFGGRRGDVPIGAGDGGSIGRIVGDGVSAIVDLSELRSGADQRQFMADFVAALRRKPPAHFQLVADEADEDIPEKGGIRDQAHFQLLEDMIWIAKRGRSAGFVLSIITQRPADVAKSALSQAQTFFVHQLTEAADREAFRKLVKDKGTTEEVRELMGKLPSLQVGARFVYAPRRHVLELGRSPLPSTFDSSRTPAPGEAKREPKMLSEIDVSAIAAALQKPREEAAIAAYAAGAEVGQLLVEKDARIRTLVEENAQLAGELEHWTQVAQRRFVMIENARAALQLTEEGVERLPIVKMDSAGTGAPTPSAPRPPAGGKGEAAATSSKAAASPDNGDPHPMAVKLAAKMDEIAPARLSWRQLASLLGYSPDGGYFRAGKRDAVTRGMLIEEGDFVRSPGPAAQGLDRQSAFDLWQAALPEPAPRMMRELLPFPSGLTKDELARTLGYATSGGHFRKGLALMRQNGVSIEEGDWVRLAAPLPGEAGGSS